MCKNVSVLVTIFFNKLVCFVLAVDERGLRNTLRALVLSSMSQRAPRGELLLSLVLEGMAKPFVPAEFEGTMRWVACVSPRRSGRVSIWSRPDDIEELGGDLVCLQFISASSIAPNFVLDKVSR